MHGSFGNGQEGAERPLQGPGGSGTFFYLAPAIRDHDGSLGGEAVLLGDRIAPRDLTIHNGIVFAD